MCKRKLTTISEFFVLNCDNLTAFAPICFFDALFTVFFNFSNVFLAAFLKVFFGVFTNFPLLSVPSALPPAGGNHQQAFTVPAGCRHPPSRQGERNMKYTDTEIRNTQIQKYCANKNKLLLPQLDVASFYSAIACESIGMPLADAALSEWGPYDSRWGGKLVRSLYWYAIYKYTKIQMHKKHK